MGDGWGAGDGRDITQSGGIDPYCDLLSILINEMKIGAHNW